KLVITYVLAVIRSLKASLSMKKCRLDGSLALSLVLNNQGEIMSFTLTSGNTDDRAIVEKLTQYLTGLLFGDRGYISKKLTTTLSNQGIELITRLKQTLLASF
ncbi:MAG: transposase, partial [Candidatus Midichloria sp.]|nr:transposase [Candidatus Midichloria sp.]